MEEKEKLKMKKKKRDLLKQKTFCFRGLWPAPVAREKNRAPSHLDKLVGHPDVFRVDPHVLGRRHRHYGHGTLVPERLVRPRTHGPDELNGGKAVVGDEHRVDRAVAAELAAAGLYLGVEGGDTLGHAHLERVGALPVVGGREL